MQSYVIKKEIMDNSNNLLELIDERWSRRSFADTPIEKKELKSIFKAGSEVASSFNEQPWHFILAQKNDAHYSDLIACLSDSNQVWAKTAPLLGVAVAKMKFSKSDKPNRHCFHDVGAFLAVASLRAMDLNIFIHQMAGFSIDKVKDKFPIPEGYEPITMFVLGYPGDRDQLPEKLRKNEHPDSKRKNVSQFLFGRQWGEPYVFDK
jgi:nitroreductase